MDIRQFRKIVKEFEKSSIHKLEVSEKDFSVKMEKNSQNDNFVETERKLVNEVAKDKVQDQQIENTNEMIKSPLVGTYYNAPSPESSPYISIGQEIKEGEVVCIVEAMKVMNEIRSPKSGVVKKIHVKNESMVEYGQPLIEFEAE